MDGIADLYYLKELLEEYYFIEKDGTLRVLSNEKRILTNEAGDEYEKRSKKYVGVLNYYFSDSLELNNRIQSTPFAYRSLIELTKDYHDNVCDDYECVDFTRNTAFSIFLEVQVSYGQSWMLLESSEDIASDRAPLFGVNVSISPAKLDESWNFLAGLHFAGNEFEHVFFYNPNPRTKRTFEIYNKASMLRIPVMVEYTFALKTIQPFLTFGFHNIFIMNPDYSVYQIYDNKSDRDLIDQEYRKYQVGVLGGVGMKIGFKKNRYLVIKGIYEYREPVTGSGYVLDNHWVSTVSANIGYGFKLQ